MNALRQEHLVIPIGSLGSVPFFLIINLLTLLYLGFIPALFLLTGFIIVHLAAIFLRIIFFRERPIKKKHHNIIEKILASSMPSMHATRGTFLFLFFAYIVKSIPALIILLGFLGLILYSRIYLKRHDAIDLLVGVTLGTVIFIFLLLSFP